VISITQHSIAPWELLRRRLEAVQRGNVIEVLAQLPIGFRRSFSAGTEIFSANGSSREAYLVVSGIAGEARLLDEGRRQILSLRLPGDVVLGDAREAVMSLTAVEVVDALPLMRVLGDYAPERQGLRRTWVAAASAEQDMLRDQVVRLGRLSAYERMAHFLVETHERLWHVGLAGPAEFHLPVRQDVVSDLLGLSVVHLSRVTQQLRRDRLAQMRSSYVTLMDREQLAAIGAYVSRFSSAPKGAHSPRTAPEVRRYANDQELDRPQSA